MAKFISGRQQQLNVGVSSSTDNKTSLQVTGKVGIGTTNADGRSLYVIGDAEVTGVTTANRFSTGVIGESINITNTTITGPETIIIDPAGVGVNTGAVRIKGDLYVDGNQTIIDSSTIELKDFQVGIASDVSTNVLLDGAGIGIGSTNIRKTLTYDYSSDSLKSSEHFDLASDKTYKINEVEVLRDTQLTIPNAYVSGLGTVITLSGTNLTYDTADIDLGYITSGVVTTLQATDVGINSAFVVSGIITTIQGTDASYTNLYVNSGVVTTISGTNLTYTNADIDNAYVTTGIVTTIGGGNLSYTIAGIQTAFINSGIVTTIQGTDASYTNLYVNSGIVTAISGTNLNYYNIIANYANVSGATTFVGVVTTQNKLFVGSDLSVAGNLEVIGTSEFIGVVTFRGGTINLGDSDTDDVVLGGELASNLVPTNSNQYDLGIYDKKWRDIHLSGTAGINTAHIVTGIVTTLQSNDISVNNIYGVVGIVTTISGTTATYSIGNITSANVTTLQSNDATAQNLYAVSGIVTTISGTNLTYTNADIDNVYVTTGIVTTLQTTDGLIENLYVTSGVTTNLSGTISTFTNQISTNSYIDNLSALSGVVTTIAGTNLNYTNGVVDNLYGVTGIITTLQGTDSVYQNLYGVVGVVTNISGTNLSYSGISTLNIVNATQINASGIVTATEFRTGAEGSAIIVTSDSITGPSTIYIDPASVGDNTGSVRIKGDFYVDGQQFIVNSNTIELADFNIGIAGTVFTDILLDGAGIGIGSTNVLKSLTYKYTTDSFRSSENIDLDSGKVYNINGSEVLSASQLTVPNISASGGISTLGNTVIGGGTTELVVGGDARITGILTIGTSSITLDGNSNTIVVGTGVTIDSTGMRISGVSSLTATTIYGDFDGELNAPGNTYYVSVNGSNTNTGDNINQAFSSLVYALSVATSGDTILVGSGTFTEVFPLTVPAGVTVKGVGGLRGTFIQPTSGTKQNDGFLLNGDTTVEDLTIGNFFEPGVGFKFASGIKVTVRSPYVQRVTVLNKGSVTTGTDPYGFDTPHTPPTYYKAGRGVYLDGSVHTTDTLEAAMLFNECTFITPNNTALEMTNGARTEWVNCFTYFADKGIYALDGAVGLGSTGYTRIKTGTFTGSTPAANDQLYYLESNSISGTYSQSGTTLTVTKVGHGLTVGDRLYADFTSGTATDGFYYINSAPDGNTFSVTAPSATTSGNVSYKEALGFGTIRSYDASTGISSFINKGEGLFQLPTERVGKTITAFGGASITTAVKKFGTGSLLLDGSGDYAKITSNTDFGFGTGDLTIETFFRPVSIGSSQNILDLRDSASDDSSLHVTLNSSNVVIVSYGTTSVITGSTSITTGQWYHVAVSRASGSTKLFVNGTQNGSTYSDSNDYGISKPLVIGADYAGTNEFDGYIDEVRISDNARYTTTFTPTTVPFVSDGNDKLIAHFDGLTGSTAFSDSSTPTQDIRWVRSGVGIATATSITLADYQKFGGDMRSIGSASVFGNTGVTADGPGSILRLFAFNFGHIGSGKDFSQDISLVNQENEVITSNNGKVYFASIDQSGDFRVGNAFYVNQESGTVNFGGQDFTLNSLSDLNITDGTNTTIITPTTLTVGNVQLSGNEVVTTSGDLVLNPSGISSTRVEGDLEVTGTLSLGYSLLGGLDGDKGDITVSASFTQWTIDSSAVTLSKIQNIGTGKVLGRTTAGSGVVEELSTTGTGNVVLSNAPTLSSLNITGDLSVDTNVLKVDSSNNRVGVNKTSPSYALDVVGDINTSTAVKVNGVSILDQASGDATALAIALG